MARVVNYDRNFSFIVLATVITIVNYDRKTFIVQVVRDDYLMIGPSFLHFSISDGTQSGKGQGVRWKVFSSVVDNASTF